MIVVKVGGEIYTISKDLSVSEGKYKKFLEACIKIVRFNYKNWKGSFPKYLYANLGNFKSIELVSLDYNPPNNPDVHY